MTLEAVLGERVAVVQRGNCCQFPSSKYRRTKIWKSKERVGPDLQGGQVEEPGAIGILGALTAAA